MALWNCSLTVLPGSTVGKSPWVEMESCCSDLHEYWRCLIYMAVIQNGILQQKPLGFFTPCSEMRYIWSCHLRVPSIAPLEHSEKSLNGFQFQSSRIPCFFFLKRLYRLYIWLDLQPAMWFCWMGMCFNFLWNCFFVANEKIKAKGSTGNPLVP